MLFERIGPDQMKARMLESLLDLYEMGDLELAKAAARDFQCRHDEADDEARCAICRMASGDHGE